MGDDGHEVYGVYQGRIACSSVAEHGRVHRVIVLDKIQSVSLSTMTQASKRKFAPVARLTPLPSKTTHHTGTQIHTETGAPQSAPFRLLLSSSSSSTATTTTYASAARS